jgi:Nif-specific regulatory protein
MNLNGSAIDEIRLSKGMKNLTLLLLINNKLSESLDLKKALRSILPMIAVQAEMKRGAIFLLKKNRDEIFFEEGYCLLDEEPIDLRFRPGQGIMGKVIATGHPAIILGISDETFPLDKTSSLTALAKEDISFIGVPMKIGKKVIGGLVVDRLFNNHISMEEDLRLLTIIASIIAQAVHLRELAEDQGRLFEDNRRLYSELRVKYRPQTIIGESKAMKNIGNYIDTLNSTNTTVLILGESGVGKERIAKAIHYRSNRSEQTFIKVSCAALPESLIESELFGYEKGAIWGAGGSRKGSLEIAAGGTLFLEEIGALTPLLQAKLLRVLKKREFERIGGNKPIKVDARIVAATNQDLEARMREGKFSKDLYYQLNVFPIIIPPLRERRQDTVLLANFFIERYAKEMGKDIIGISSSAIDLLTNYCWPGNVQELKGCIERAVLLSTDGMIHHYHLPPSVRGSTLTGRRETECSPSATSLRII